MTLIDHLTLNVSDYARSKAFYEKALAPLGVAAVMEFGEACGFGRDKKPDFWIGKGPTSFQKPEHLAPITPVHIAFSARSQDEVRAFHAAALAAGAPDFGAPGPATGRPPPELLRRVRPSTPTGTTSRRSATIRCRLRRHSALPRCPAPHPGAPPSQVPRLPAASVPDRRHRSTAAIVAPRVTPAKKARSIHAGTRCRACVAPPARDGAPRRTRPKEGDAPRPCRRRRDPPGQAAGPAGGLGRPPRAALPPGAVPERRRRLRSADRALRACARSNAEALRSSAGPLRWPVSRAPGDRGDGRFPRADPFSAQSVSAGPGGFEVVAEGSGTRSLVRQRAFPPSRKNASE